MIEIIINDKLAAICLPEITNLIVQSLIPNIGINYKIEVREHQEEKKEAK